MLQLTTQAAELIRELRTTHGGGDELLRVSSRGAGPSQDLDLMLAFVSTAGHDDQVGDSEGISVCVASDVADALDDKVLDVSERPEGRGLVIRAA
jgi:Fe-S cluster assembly iron-binding protein IscA